MDKTGRMPCLVPGCRRTIQREEPDDTEGICSKHWSLTDPRVRRLYRRCRRVERTQPARRSVAFEVGTRCWRKLKKQAIERSMGI